MIISLILAIICYLSILITIIYTIYIRVCYNKDTKDPRVWVLLRNLDYYTDRIWKLEIVWQMLVPWAAILGTGFLLPVILC